jgi:hypothetical protein
LQGYSDGVNVGSILLAPVRVPVRVAQALDDLATLAERARRDPDPVEEVRDRIDALLAEIATLNGLATQLLPVAAGVTAVGREIVDGGQELTAEARALNVVSREIRDGGEDLTLEARALRAVAREIVDGGERLTLEARALRGVSEDLEDAVETVADTVEPLQGAAESVGRVTKRFSRSS